MKKSILFLVVSVLFSFLSMGQNTCQTPAFVSTLPFVLNNATTEGSGNDYNSTMVCQSDFMNGEDYVFLFVPTADLFVRINVTNTSTSLFGGVGLFVTKGCPDLATSECVASTDASPGSALTLPVVSLEQGEQYYIIISTKPGALNLYKKTTFNILIEETFAKDVGVVSIDAPISGCSLNDNEAVKASIKNFGFEPIANFNIKYSVNAGADVVQLVIDTLLPGATRQIIFVDSVDLMILGDYIISVTTQLTGDQNALNNQRTKTMANLEAETVYPYFTDFESSEAGWRTEGSNSSWELGTPDASIINSAASGTNAWVTNLSGNHTSNEQSALVSPCFDLSGLDLPMINVKINYEIPPGIAGFGGGNVVLQSSIDNGLTWTSVPTDYAAQNWFSGTGWSGNSNGWVSVRTSIPSLVGQTNVIFRFSFTGSSTAMNIGEGIGVDDFKILETPPYDAGVASILSLSSGCGLGDEIVSIKLRNFGSAPTDTLLSVAYVVNGGSPIVEDIPVSLNSGDSLIYNFETILDLSSPGIYNIKTYTILDGDVLVNENDTARKTIYSFITIDEFPYLEDLESYNGNWLPQGTNSSWEYGTPNAPMINQAASGTKCWATNLTGNHNSSETSYLVSPCIDLTNFDHPYFKMKIWYETPLLNRVSFEASLDNGITWFTLGSNTTSPEWFSSANGWSGHSEEWISVGHQLDTLANMDNVRLRVSYNTLMSTDEGVAIDDMEIIECTLPVVAFTSQINENTVTFTNNSSNSDTYFWDFDDDETSTDENPVHIFQENNRYNVCLSAYNYCTFRRVCQRIEIATGMDEFDNNELLKIYPNPTQNILTVEHTNKSGNSLIIKIFDMKGAVVLEDLFMSNEAMKQIDVSKFKRGIYTIMLGSYNKRFVVE